MTMSRTEIMEAIRADLTRDQKEIQEIEKRLPQLQERAQANRAWLKAYGFLEQTGTAETTPIPYADEPAAPSLTIEDDSHVDAGLETAASMPEVQDDSQCTLQETASSVLLVEYESQADPVLETAASVIAIQGAGQASGATSETASSLLKADGRKKLYDALISRGARINS